MAIYMKYIKRAYKYQYYNMGQHTVCESREEIVNDVINDGYFMMNNVNGNYRSFFEQLTVTKTNM